MGYNICMLNKPKHGLHCHRCCCRFTVGCVTRVVELNLFKLRLRGWLRTSSSSFHLFSLAFYHRKNLLRHSSSIKDLIPRRVNNRTWGMNHSPVAAINHDSSKKCSQEVLLEWKKLKSFLNESSLACVFRSPFRGDFVLFFSSLERVRWVKKKDSKNRSVKQSDVGCLNLHYIGVGPCLYVWLVN